MNRLLMYGEGVKRKLINKCGKKYLVAITGFIIIALCFLHSLSAGHYADFWPINGTFQNYNPVRRFLSGQVPYRDFIDYLGLGHLYVGSFITMLFGNSYRASLIAFSFLTIFSLAYASLMLGKAICGSIRVTFMYTILLLLMLLIQPFFYVNGIVFISEFKNALDAALNVGNSARFVRGLVLPICIFLILYGYKWINVQSNKHQWNDKKIEIYRLVLLSVLSGFSFAWSNDYGISCWLCIAIMYFWILFSEEHNFIYALVYSIIEVLLSMISLFLWVEVLTLGHFGQWFSTTFGTGGYQGWYYNSEKNYYIYNIDSSYIMLIQAFICVVYLFKIYNNCGERNKTRYIVPAFANMACFCAVNEYHMLSGGESREYALSVLLITIYYEIIHFISKLFNKKMQYISRIVTRGIIIISFAWIVSTIIMELEFTIEEKNGEYIAELDGNMTSLGSDLKDASEFLDGEDFFATYASAQEVVENKYQPSGVDYIIHVLGDDKRADYLDTFKAGDFKYTATIKDTFSHWEYWVQRANWFFYRELYQKWHPVYSNTYEMYWERNNNGESNTIINNFSVAVEDLDIATKKLIVKADKSVNGIADVYIDYAVKKKSGIRAKLLFQTMLKVENTGTIYADKPYYESNFLRSVNAEYIPITIVDGYGEVVLTSLPEASTFLEIYNVKCSNIYQVIFDYVEINTIEDGKDRLIISTVNNPKNQKALQNVAAVVVGEKTYTVSEVTSDKNYLYVAINREQTNINNDILKKNNILRIVRQ